MTDQETGWHFSDLQEQAAALVSLLERAQRQITLFVHHLEHALYEQDQVIHDLKRVALRHQNNQVRLCVQDHLFGEQSCPRFIQLLHQLPSRCQVKQASQKHQVLDTNYILVDDRYYLRQPVHWKPEGDLHLAAPGACALLGEEFEVIWAQAGSHPEFKQFAI